MGQQIAQALLKTIFLFGFAGWVYIALNAVFHPESLSWPLTHFALVPREDTFGAICFVSSAVSYFFLQFFPEKK